MLPFSKPFFLFRHGLASIKGQTSQPGHEDIDQAFSQQAAMLSRHEFSTPEDVVGLIDSSFRPELAADLERKRQTKSKVDAMAYKLDQVADWKAWSAPLGVKLLGLRVLLVILKL